MQGTMLYLPVLEMDAREPQRLSELQVLTLSLPGGGCPTAVPSIQRQHRRKRDDDHNKSSTLEPLLA
jgi:hypothetical protein